jgi:hypothetical protein
MPFQGSLANSARCYLKLPVYLLAREQDSLGSFPSGLRSRNHRHIPSRDLPLLLHSPLLGRDQTTVPFGDLPSSVTAPRTYLGTRSTPGLHPAYLPAQRRRQSWPWITAAPMPCPALVCLYILAWRTRRSPVTCSSRAGRIVPSLSLFGKEKKPQATQARGDQRARPRCSIRGRCYALLPSVGPLGQRVFLSIDFFSFFNCCSFAPAR